MKWINRIAESLNLYNEVDLDAEEAEAEARAAAKAEAHKEKEPLFRKKVMSSPTEVVAVEQDEKPKKSFLGRFSKKRDDVPAVPAVSAPTDKMGSRTISLPIDNKLVSVVVIEPASFDDSPKIADYLRKGQPVVVNFEKTDNVLAMRMTDFISGTIYAINGSMKKLSRTILVCAPKNVDIDADSEEPNERSGQLWKK